MQKPIKENGRQVSINLGQDQTVAVGLIEQMKSKVDSDYGRHTYSQRLGSVEPVFGNINTTKRLNRFTLRGKTKVDAQWMMFCLVHNIEKIQRYAS